MIKNLSEQTSSFGLCPPRSYYTLSAAGKRKRRGNRAGARFAEREWGFRAYEKLADTATIFARRYCPKK